MTRPSTPPEAVDEVLAGERPPTVAEVERTVRQARARTAPSAPAQNPQIADSDSVGTEDDRHTAQAAELLREIALSLTELAKLAEHLAATPQTTRALGSCEAALSTIRAALARRTG